MDRDRTVLSLVLMIGHGENEERFKLFVVGMMKVLKLFFL